MHERIRCSVDNAVVIPTIDIHLSITSVVCCSSECFSEIFSRINQTIGTSCSVFTNSPELRDYLFLPEKCRSMIIPVHVCALLCFGSTLLYDLSRFIWACIISLGITSHKRLWLLRSLKRTTKHTRDMFQESKPILLAFMPVKSHPFRKIWRTVKSGIVRFMVVLTASLTLRSTRLSPKPTGLKLTKELIPQSWSYSLLIIALFVKLILTLSIRILMLA